MGKENIRPDGSTPLILGEYISDDINSLLEVKRELDNRLTNYSKHIDVKWRFKLHPTDFKHILRVYVKTYGETSPADIQELVS